MNDDELLTKPGACALLKLSPRTLDRLSARGEIPSLRIGRARGWRKASLFAWVAAKERGPASALSPGATAPARSVPAGATPGRLTCPRCGPSAPLACPPGFACGWLRCSRYGHVSPPGTAS